MARVLDCTSITPECTVENTIYGYYPSLPVNALFVAIFALLAIFQIGFGVFYKTYFYSSVVAVGCIAEVLGYAGRLIMHNNPYDNLGFNIQISCLIFAPSFIAAGVYIVFKQFVKTFGAAKSRIPPNWYLIIFMVCDLVALLLQASGGGLAGSADDNVKQRDQGTDVMMAGIVFQVFTIFVFLCLGLDYFIRTRRSWDQVPSEGQALATKTSFRLFAVGIVIAILAIFFRCVYRIAELAGGWANPIMRDEPGYIVMEGVMIIIAAVIMTVLHPGFCFPQLGRKSVLKSSDADSTEEYGMNGAWSKGLSTRTSV